MYKLNKDASVLNGVHAEKSYDVVLPSFSVMYKANDLWNILQTTVNLLHHYNIAKWLIPMRQVPI